MFTVMAFGLYTTAVTTLASRRQDLFLKRLRSTAASDRSILAGLVLPVAVIALIQVVAILAVFGVVDHQSGPAPAAGGGGPGDDGDDAGPGAGHRGAHELARARPGDHPAGQPRR